MWHSDIQLAYKQHQGNINMIILVGNIKGGVGKSTIACNLATFLAQAHSAPVTLIDGDKQGTSANFTAQREETLGSDSVGYICARAVGSEVRTQAKGFSERGGTVIIDAGGQDNVALRAALSVADMMLIPLPPKSIDIWSLDEMTELIQAARETVNPDLKAYAFINMGFPTGQDNQTAQAIVKEDYPQVELIPRTICHRKAFSDGMGMGLSILEKTPVDIKAREEFLSVVHEAGLYQDNVISMGV